MIRTTQQHGRGVAALVLSLSAGAVLVAGCSSPAEEEAPWSHGAFSDQISDAIDEAVAGGASDRQIALLEEARDAGSMTTEMTRLGVANVIECFTAYGGTAEPRDAIKAPGLINLGYLVGSDEDLGEAQIDLYVTSCDTQEFRWVSYIFQQQPSSRDIIGHHVMSQEPILRACLEREGIQTDPDATGWDLAQLALEMNDESDVGLNCLWEANITNM
jgi:hypothetical protein